MTRLLPEGCSRRSRNCLPVLAEDGAHDEKDSKDRGNDGLWKTRKTESRFSIVSHSPWKSPERDSHIPPAPATTARKSGNPKAGFPLSRRGSCSLKKQRKETPLNVGFPVVQAHRSIGICCLKLPAACLATTCTKWVWQVPLAQFGGLIWPTLSC